MSRNRAGCLALVTCKSFDPEDMAGGILKNWNLDPKLDYRKRNMELLEMKYNKLFEKWTGWFSIITIYNVK